MVSTECRRQLELFEVGQRVVTVDFEGGDVVTDAGLLPIRQLDQRLGILAEAASRLPDPRSPLLIQHSVEELLSQRVYQILAGYPDGNDAQQLRHDPLFKTLAGRAADSEVPLASGSTLNRFLHAYTRREHEKPLAQRSTLFECRNAQLQRIRGLNEFLVDVFVRTRKRPPAHVIIDLDPTDDACHGQQQLSFWHGYYEQNQYFPMHVFDGETGLPLAAWLRPGKLHAACGAVEIVGEIVARLRAHWPDVMIFVRGDNGVASPEMYEFCEAEGLLYAFGYASNDVLQRRVAEEELEHEAKLRWWITRQPAQVFSSFDDYQAATWSRPRRVLAKSEITATGGTNTRFVVTNLSGHAAGIYHGFYVQRGNVPERPIGELKNGLAMDRLSSHRFLANSQKLLCHVLAYLLWSLFREANAEVPELAKLEVGTARTRLFKVGALVKTSSRRVLFQLASHWPGQSLYTQATTAVSQFVRDLHSRWRSLGWELPRRAWCDAKDRVRIAFAPTPPLAVAPTLK